MPRKSKAARTIDLMAVLQASLDKSKKWRCMQCSYAHESGDKVALHNANTDHQPFYGTKADLEHHRKVCGWPR